MTDITVDLQRIQLWYNSCCDGDWEHDYGITIATLDNPGWSVTVDLEGTSLEDATLNKPKGILQQDNWIRCWIENKKFYGIGDPFQLASILSHFVELIDATVPDETWE